MSIDIEDWFHVENLKSVIARSSWDERELRVERNTDRILELMDRHDVRSTYFVLGWVADKVPALIRRIADAGHEIASHGYGHELVYSLSEAAFREDIDRSIKLLQDTIGADVRGYRAPSFSITDWAIDILVEYGFTYDSSAFSTVAHDRHGMLSGIDADTPIAEIRPGFTEVCISCLKLGKRGLPWGGGGYFRVLPYPIFHRGIRRILRRGQPYVFYMHPWEIDAGQPHVTGLKRSHEFRRYVNVNVGELRFDALLRDFEWVTIQEVLEWWKNCPSAVAPCEGSDPIILNVHR